MKKLIFIFYLMLLNSCNSLYIRKFNGFINPVYTYSEPNILLDSEKTNLILYVNELIKGDEDLIKKINNLKNKYPKIQLGNEFNRKLHYFEITVDLIKEFNYNYYTIKILKDANNSNCHNISLYYRTSIYTYIFKDQCLISFNFKKCNNKIEFEEIINLNKYYH